MFEIRNVFRRISFRCSSTILNIAESKLRVYCMLGRAVESTVVELVELRFERIAVAVDMCFAELSGALGL